MIISPKAMETTGYNLDFLIDGPVYIVMEYAHHGNLKDYLECCKADLLQRNVPIHVGTEKGKPCIKINVHTLC